MFKLTLFILLVFTTLGTSLRVHALELQGFVTSDCHRHTGMIVGVESGRVDFIDLDGQLRSLQIDAVDKVYAFNVIDNPIQSFNVDAAALKRLKAVYIEDSGQPLALAFAVRFIEDLVIFYSLDGKSHVHTLADVYKLRPAPASALGRHTTKSYKKTSFEFTDQSGRCASANVVGTVKPTRVLADRISISDFFHSFEQGYEALESFQERTYLYARPLLFDQHTRLGLVFQGSREEPALNLPLYFQWASGEPYRFQSWSAVGLKAHEFLPNTEPVLSLRSDVKSHIFHGMFIGNVAGLPAGTSIFLNDSNGGTLTMTRKLTVQPTFNYLVMMGGDYGPYSASVGFFYPDYGFKVHDEYREVRGSSPTYAVRAMLTTKDYRFRAISGFTKYNKANASKADVLAKSGENGNTETVSSFEFQSTFLRGGVDYTFSPRLRASLDGIAVNGSYKELRNSQSSDLHFNKLTIQGAITQSFGNYVSLTGYVNVLQNNYETNFLSQPYNDEQRETRFFGTFEFIF